MKLLRTLLRLVSVATLVRAQNVSTPEGIPMDPIATKPTNSIQGTQMPYTTPIPLTFITSPTTAFPTPSSVSYTPAVSVRTSPITPVQSDVPVPPTSETSQMGGSTAAPPLDSATTAVTTIGTGPLFPSVSPTTSPSSAAGSSPRFGGVVGLSGFILWTIGVIAVAF